MAPLSSPSSADRPHDVSATSQTINSIQSQQMSPITPSTSPSTGRLHRHSTSPTLHREPPKGVSLLCGLVAGVAQAGLFNPYDRALYLSVKHHRPFLDKRNFQNSFQGFLQSVGGRALASGLCVCVMMIVDLHYVSFVSFCLTLSYSSQILST